MAVNLGINIQRSPNRINQQLREAGVGGKYPKLLLDFADNYYLASGGSKTLANAVTHARAGNATMTDGYGPELVTNGGFDSDSDWTKGTGWSIQNNRAYHASGSNSNITQNIAVEADKAYILEFNILEGSADFLWFAVDGVFTAVDNPQVRGGRSFVFTHDTTETISVGVRAGSSNVAAIDNVSVREMPVIKWAPHNLLRYSEEFDNAAWTKSQTSVNANQTTAPDGFSTADLVTYTTNSTAYIAGLVNGLLSEHPYNIGFFAKYESKGLIQWLSTGFSQYYVNFDVENGVVGSSGTAISNEAITDVGDGWYFCSFTVTLDSNDLGISYRIYGIDALTDTYAAGSTSGGAIYLWGAHVHRSDLGGMVDNPERGDSYVPTALRPFGANLVTNGTFDTDTTNWTGSNGASLSVSNGALVVTADGATVRPQARQTITGLTVGKAYELTGLAKSGVNNFPVEIEIVGIAGQYEHSSTSFQRITRAFVATSTSHQVNVKLESDSIPQAGSTGEFDDISVRESSVRPDTARYLPRIGHHVYNGSAWVNEGLLAESESRVNLFTHSEDFSNAAWTKSNASVTKKTGIVAPDGSENVYHFQENTSISQHQLSTSITAGTQAFSVFAKGDGSGRYLKIYGYGLGSNSESPVFDVDNGIVYEPPTQTHFLSASIQDVGNGWYRCSLRANTDGGSGSPAFALVDSTNSHGVAGYTGDGTSGVYLYGAQLETTSGQASSYIPTSGSSVTRAAETFTIPSANLPWPSPQYIGSELVTNGTFDTGISGWVARAGCTLSQVSGRLRATFTGAGPARVYTAITTEVGKVYEIKCTGYNLENNENVYFQNISSVDIATKSLINNVEVTLVVVATETSHRIEFGNVSSGTGTYFELDNISVREIDPLSVSIAMDGRMTYADTNTGPLTDGNSGEDVFVSWRTDSSNYISIATSTFSTMTGRVYALQEASGTSDFVNTGETTYSPDVLVPFNAASRHGSTFINLATDGVALTANTTPTALPDLSATDLELAYDYMGTIGTFRVWDRDIADTGLVEATNPSLEPSLSLTFEGTGTNSFIVNDWSE